MKRTTSKLYTSSITILLAYLANSLAGFLFWILASTLYTSSEIGIASALVSSVTLSIVLSRFGLEQSMVSEFPHGDRGKITATAILFTTASALAVSMLLLLVIEPEVGESYTLANYLPHYVGFVVSASTLSIVGTALVASRRADLYLAQSMIQGLKLAFLFGFVSFGAMGVFFSIGLPYAIAAAFCGIALAYVGVRMRGFDAEFLRRTSRFSFSNYASTMLISIPGSVFPILVLVTLGPESTAEFYIAYVCASVLLMIPTAFSTSFFVEASHDNLPREHFMRAMRTVVIFMSVLACGIVILAEDILRIIGYSQSSSVLTLVTLVIASVPGGILSMYLALARIRKNNMVLICVPILTSSLMLVVGGILMVCFGTGGIGFGWIVGYGCGCAAIVLLMNRNQSVEKKMQDLKHA